MLQTQKSSVRIVRSVIDGQLDGRCKVVEWVQVLTAWFMMA